MSKNKGLEYKRTDQLSTGSKGRKPDYWVKMMNKDTNEKRKIGAGWKNDDGSISIDIDCFTVISAHPALVITMFPIDRSES